MKAWQVKRFIVEEIKCEILDKNNRNIFDTKEGAFKTAINRVNKRISKNSDYLEFLREEVESQSDVLDYYVSKKDKLVAEVKTENIKLDDTIL